MGHAATADAVAVAVAPKANRVCSPAHIGALAAFAAARDALGWRDIATPALAANAIADALAQAVIAARPDVGPAEHYVRKACRYAIAYVTAPPRAFTWIDVYRMCERYELDACGADTWDESPARAYIDTLKRFAVALAPGFTRATYDFTPVVASAPRRPDVMRGDRGRYAAPCQRGTANASRA